MKALKSSLMASILTLLISFQAYAEDTTHTMLKEPIQALNARVESLLGRELSAEEINNQNPYLDLDLSQAPKLKTIMLSSLLVTHDFVGTLLLRLLEHHAKQGAKVFVMVSKRFVFEKEKKWLSDFKKSSPNITLIEYKNEKADNMWTKVQSTNHVKVFLTENSDSSQCSMISGGRNTSDMYFFASKPNHSKFPELVQWGDKNYEWGHFDDLDIKTEGCESVLKVKKTMLNYFQNYLVGSSTQNEDYVLSMNEDKMLENKYVSMINSAEESIKILSPYINLTPKLYQALLAAKAKGVRVEIVTAQSLMNDYLPVFLQVQQNHNLKKLMKEFNVYLYSNKNYIPHAKAMLIDSKVLTIGSVNMNRRSFIYDNEFTQFIKNDQTISDFLMIYEGHYQAHSKQVIEGHKFKKSMLIVPMMLFRDAF